MTGKLYDQDAYIKEFDATVLCCTPRSNGYAILLNQTAFFPEEGGQECDTGFLNTVEVKAVRLEGENILHITETPISKGEVVHGVIDFRERYRKMQNHSGEHIVSGLFHTLYGLTNVGFHLGSEDVTLDLSGEVDRAALDRVETLANEIIYQNLPISASYPPPEVLRDLRYRAKLDLEENVRIVSIPGVDACACCAPHVRFTGEIGIIKLLDFIRYKGGVRIHMLCGADALMDYRMRHRVLADASAAMSVKQHEVAQGTERLIKEIHALKYDLRTLKSLLAAEKAKAFQGEDTVIAFETEHDIVFWREVANQALEAGCQFAAFFLGNDNEGYAYVICSSASPLKEIAINLNRVLCGKGGGNNSIIQGTLNSKKNEIISYINNILS